MKIDGQPIPLEDWRTFKWILLACSLLFLAMAVPAMLGYVPVSDDLGAFHLPLRSIYAHCLRNGDSFDWVSNLYSGFYLSGEGQVGTYHPVHWGLYRWLPLGAAFNVELLLSYLFMLLGTFLFLNRILQHSDAALFGAMVFTFSGFNLLHFVHPNAIAIVAHLPWLLLAVDVAWRDARPRHRIFAEMSLALLLASQILLGYPQYVWICSLALVSFVVFLSWRDGIRAKSYLACSVALMLGVAIGAVQLIPTFDVLAHSSRQTRESSFYHTGALHPLNLVQLVSPYLFRDRVVGGNTHELGIYLGATPLLLLCWLFARRRKLKQHRQFSMGVAAFGLVALLLASGKHGLIYNLQTFLPLVGQFRNPARYILLFHFAAAILVAVAFVELKSYFADANHDSEPYRPGVIPTIFSSVIAITAYLLLDRQFLGSPMLVASGPLLFLVSTIQLRQILRCKRTAMVTLVTLILFTATDLGVYGLSYAVLTNNVRLDDYIGGMDGPPKRDRYRIIVDRQLRDDDDQLRSGNRWVLGGWYQADGYAGLDPVMQLFGDNTSMQSLQAANVRWVRNCGKNNTISGLIPNPNGWLEVPHPCPRARLVTACVVSADAGTKIQEIAPEVTAIVASPLNLSSGPVGAARIVTDDPGRIQIRTHVPTTQLLVVSERYHSGWFCLADNEPRPVLPVYGDFMGCVLKPGTRDVQLSFRPQSLKTGKWVTGFGLVGLACFAICRRMPWAR